MKKGKLKQTINTDDAIWFHFEASNHTFKILDHIFDLFEEFDFYEATTKYDYAFLIRSGQYNFVLENDSFTAYLIFTTEYTNIILRKENEWEAIKDKVLQKFEFAKPKDVDKKQENKI